MRVTFNSFSDGVLPQINRQAALQAKLQNQISSGQKISQPDEDPLVAGRLLSLQTASAQVQQFYRNAGYALEISRSSFSAVDEVRKVSDRVGEIAISAVGPTSVESFDTYATEVDQMLEHAVAAANQQFDGKYLLGGTKTDTPPFTVARDAQNRISSVTYAGAADGAVIQVGENASISPFTDGTANGKLGDFMNQLVALRGALQNHDSAAVIALRPAMDESEQTVLSTLGRMGALQSRLQVSQDAGAARYGELTGRISQDNDVDLSLAVVALTKSQTAYQAAIQSAAKIMSKSLLDYV